MPEFRGEIFHGWLSNRKIRERFLPRKIPAMIWYDVQRNLSTIVTHGPTVSGCNIEVAACFRRA